MICISAQFFPGLRAHQLYSVSRRYFPQVVRTIFRSSEFLEETVQCSPIILGNQSRRVRVRLECPCRRQSSFCSVPTKDRFIIFKVDLKLARSAIVFFFCGGGYIVSSTSCICIFWAAWCLWASEKVKLSSALVSSDLFPSTTINRFISFKCRHFLL